MVALAARKDEEQPGLTGLNKTFMAELGREVREGEGGGTNGSFGINSSGHNGIDDVQEATAAVVVVQGESQGEVSQETGSAADSSAKVGYVPVLGQRHRPRKPSSSSSSSSL